MLADAPPWWRVGQLDPVELGLLTGGMGDDRGIAAAADLAWFAVRAQAVLADRRGQARIRAGEAELLQLVEQRRRPQVGVGGPPPTGGGRAPAAAGSSPGTGR